MPQTRKSHLSAAHRKFGAPDLTQTTDRVINSHRVTGVWRLGNKLQQGDQDFSRDTHETPVSTDKSGAKSDIPPMSDYAYCQYGH